MVCRLVVLHVKELYNTEFAGAILLLDLAVLQTYSNERKQFIYIYTCICVFVCVCEINFKHTNTSPNTKNDKIKTNKMGGCG